MLAGLGRREGATHGESQPRLLHALQVPERQLPLCLTAAKSSMGHAETGAGALGILSASMQLSQAAANALAQLRSLNSYVVSAMDGAGLRARLPRQAAPRLATAADYEAPHAMGISSFAFQVRILPAAIGVAAGVRCRVPGDAA